MPKVDADPEKLKQLAKDLQAGAEQCEQIVRQMQQAVARADWRDPEGVRFAEQVKEQLRPLARVADGLRSRFPTELRRKVAALEQFRS
jgi:ABC-type transporter Mla subunit MlaD